MLRNSGRDEALLNEAEPAMRQILDVIARQQEG